jgi:hypothetical protein
MISRPLTNLSINKLILKVTESKSVESSNMPHSYLIGLDTVSSQGQQVYQLVKLMFVWAYQIDEPNSVGLAARQIHA